MNPNHLQLQKQHESTIMKYSKLNN